MKRDNPEVVGVGMCTWDFIYQLSDKPGFEKLALALSSHEEGGGPTATALATASKLGVESTYIGKVGGDHIGKRIIENFEEYGVKTHLIERANELESNVTIVLVEEGTGKRGFVLKFSEELEAKELSEKAVKTIENADYLLIDNHYPLSARRAAQVAKDSGTKVVSDLETQKKGTEKIIDLTDILIIPEKFATSYTKASEVGKVPNLLLEKGPKAVVITRGERGSLGTSIEASFKAPSFSVNVTDTTGAGDVYHGAFVVGLTKGWKYERVAEFASAISAMSCTELGGRRGIPTLEEALSFLNKRSDGW